MRLVILFNVFLNPSFKMMTSFTNIAKTTVSTKWIYILGNIWDHQELGLYMKNNF